jgi:Flp pilus assembly protein TadG
MEKGISKNLNNFVYDENIFIYHYRSTQSDPVTYSNDPVISPKYLRYRGIALVWGAVVVLLLILLVGLSLDTAKVYLVVHQLQNAADAAALAGAIDVKADRSKARVQAQAIAAQNIADSNFVTLNLNEDNDPNGDIVLGWYNRLLKTFTPVVDANDPANSVMVVASRNQTHDGPVSLNFGPIVSVNSISLSGKWQLKSGTYAIAMAVGGTGAGLIALADTGRGVEMNGDFTLTVVPMPPALPGEGEVQINSGDDDALTVIGNSTQIDASAINIWGDAYLTSDELEIPYTTEAPPIPDPLASLPEPTWSDTNDLTTATKLRVGDPHPNWNRITINSPDPNGNPWEIYPGYYSGGFYIDGGDAPNTPCVHFNPGVYILGGSSGAKTAGLCVQAGGYAVSEEAMFYITGDGIVDIQGNGGLRATPPKSGTYEGVTIFQARDNYNESWIQGTADLDLDGTLYFPHSEFTHILGGGWGFGNQLIGWRFEIQGSGIVGIQYDGRNRAPTNKSFLVE